MLLAGLVARLWCAWHAQDAHVVLAGVREIAAIAMLLALSSAASWESRRFDRARGEQALLCLTPAAPDRAELNGVLARLFMAGFVRSWALLAASTLVALAVAGAQAGELARFALAWLPSLGFAAWPLRNFARAHDAPHWPLVLLGVVMAAVFSVANDGGASLAEWVVGSLTVTLIALAVVGWRWRAMVAAPPALPAGRLA